MARKKTNEKSSSGILTGLLMILIAIIGFFHENMLYLGDAFFNFSNWLLGYLNYVLFALLLIGGVLKMRRSSFTNSRLILPLCLLLFVALVITATPKDHELTGKAILTSFFEIKKSPISDQITQGGIFGALIYALFSALMGFKGTVIICIVIAFAALALLISSLNLNFKLPKPKPKEKKENTPAKLPPLVDHEVFDHGHQTTIFDQPQPEQFEETQPQPVLKKPIINEKAKEEVSDCTVDEDNQDQFVLPDINLVLDQYLTNKKNANVSYAAEKWRRMSDALENFGYKSNLTRTNFGPAIIQYEIEPDQSLKKFNIKKYNQVSDHLKMKMAVEELRFVIPIPGKDTVGVEIPNLESVPVRMKELMKAMPKEMAESPTAFCLGKNLEGECVYANLDKMTHLMIAGQTGSGKSVCMNSILTSILLKSTPSQVKLLLIDPKKVEFTPYRQVPHLIAPIIDDNAKAAMALNCLVNVMEKRYESFAQMGVRDIATYNQTCSQKMYYIVCAIDELADLMATHRAEVETSIARLASKARAAGVYLVLATQRPSTDVITGTIKANIPSRIAFAVTNQFDSRTIIDMVGAEALRGNGDMLFYPKYLRNPARVQGVYVTDEEIRRITDYFEKAGFFPRFEDAFILDDESDSGYSILGEKMNAISDPEYKEVRRWVMTQKKISASIMQSHFRFGYPKAKRFIDALYEEGIISEERGSKGREVLIHGDEPAAQPQPEIDSATSEQN